MLRKTEGKRRREQQRLRWLDGITNSVDMNLSKLQKIVGDRGYCSPWYHKESDMTLPTKIHLVKAMVFPVVMYGCESWTIMKAEDRKIDAFLTVVLDKTLESPLECKEIQSVHPKGNQP